MVYGQLTGKAASCHAFSWPRQIDLLILAYTYGGAPEQQIVLKKEEPLPPWPVLPASCLPPPRPHSLALAVIIIPLFGHVHFLGALLCLGLSTPLVPGVEKKVFWGYPLGSLQRYIRSQGGDFCAARGLLPT